MEWVKFNLPLPVFQQRFDETCTDFLLRIESVIGKDHEMKCEECVFWFLLGAREDVLEKLPFNPTDTEWMEPSIVMEEYVRTIDSGSIPQSKQFRLNRLQNCSNFFLCYKCSKWGHKAIQCREPRNNRELKDKRKLHRERLQQENKDNPTGKQGFHQTPKTTFPSGNKQNETIEAAVFAVPKPIQSSRSMTFDANSRSMISNPDSRSMTPNSNLMTSNPSSKDSRPMSSTAGIMPLMSTSTSSRSTPPQNPNPTSSWPTPQNPNPTSSWSTLPQNASSTSSWSTPQNLGSTSSWSTSQNPGSTSSWSTSQNSGQISLRSMTPNPSAMTLNNSLQNSNPNSTNLSTMNGNNCNSVQNSNPKKTLSGNGRLMNNSCATVSLLTPSYMSGQLVVDDQEKVNSRRRSYRFDTSRASNQFSISNNYNNQLHQQLHDPLMMSFSASTNERKSSQQESSGGFGDDDYHARFS